MLKLGKVDKAAGGFSAPSIKQHLRMSPSKSSEDAEEGGAAAGGNGVGNDGGNLLAAGKANSISEEELESRSSSVDVSSDTDNEEVEEEEEEEECQEEPFFFEGVEKLLEVWFTAAGMGEEKDAGDGEGGEVKRRKEDCDLRKIPRRELERMLRPVKCSIISSARNGQVDAYVLSESSMFVSQRRFILKTCGTTTPLQCIQELLGLVKVYAGFDTIEEIYYSRKNFERPDLQMKPHRSFEQEVALLDRIFADGAAYCMGTINRDCWYLYTLNPLDRYVTGRVDVEPDQTIEILMTELDPDVMKLFTKMGVKDGREATKLSGIDKIIPTMKIDEYLFEPCGYSMNGILKNESCDYGLGEYMTIHITPEPEFSYVSFESNVPLTSYLGVIQRVLDIFLPGKFILTIFANRTSMAAECHKELQKRQHFGDWIRNDIQYSSFQNYELTYAHFVRFPS